MLLKKQLLRREARSVDRYLLILENVTRRRSGARLTKEKCLVVYGFLDRFFLDKPSGQSCAYAK